MLYRILKECFESRGEIKRIKMKYKRYNTIIPKCDEYQRINSSYIKRGFTQLFNEQELKNNNFILTNNKSEDEI